MLFCQVNPYFPLNLSYSNQETIMQLLESVPDCDPMFCPNFCGRSYKGKYRKHNLKRHMMLSCGVNAQFECTFCQKRFRSNQILKVHLAYVHDILPNSINLWKNIECFVQMVVADHISGKTANTISTSI
ncbi:uncharacterized protein LOC132952475 [Metopolophium dirhodum]|uniref:uncharacterized protein LOC132952475 n=1 Tax=Metopolophium dirhodum TaxID=44670 RepID=UPI00298F6B4B|nr:uncharacterized protein LOC132952475 [Metopolophium dirhodum]